MFVLPFVINGLTIACLSRHMQQSNQAYLLKNAVTKNTTAALDHTSIRTKWIVTYAEALQNYEKLIQSARETLHICAMALHLARVMPSGQSLASLINMKAEQGVKVYIMMNSTCEYANLSPSQTRDQLHPSVFLYASRNPTHEFKHYLFNQIGYSFMHMKMCCADLTTMQIGCIDVDPWERLDYDVLNKNNFAWHEIATEFKCTPAISQWVLSVFHSGSCSICPEVAPPFPLVCAGPYEADVMCQLMETAKDSIYLEHQIISMGPSEDMSVQRILEVIARKLALIPHFQVVFITNTQQDDEYNSISRHFSALSLMATKYHLEDAVKRLMHKSGLTFNKERHYKQVRYLNLLCTGGQNLKAHSNITIVDTSYAIRSSSNITSRSLGFNPCDMELGIVSSSNVESLLHQLILLHCPLLEDPAPSIAMFLTMVNSGLSHAKPVKFPDLPLFLIDWCMSLSHLHASSGHCHGKMIMQEVQDFSYSQYQGHLH